MERKCSELFISWNCLDDLHVLLPSPHSMVVTYWEAAVSASLNNHGQCSQIRSCEISTSHAGCDGHGPCLHGTCEQAANGSYVCNCDDGWYGPECDVPGSASHYQTCVCCAIMESKYSESFISWKCLDDLHGLLPSSHSMVVTYWETAVSA